MNLIGPSFTRDQIREYSNELQLTDDTPPTYLTSGTNDQVVDVKNSLYFAAALKQPDVPVELFCMKRLRMAMA